MTKRILTAALLLLITTPVLHAGGGQTTGMQFLLTGPSAHNMGISEGNTASLSGASSIFLNPSMLALEKQSSATISYMIWPATDTQNSFAGLAYRRDNDAFGVAFMSSLIDDVAFRQNPTQNPDGTFSVRYFSVATSYARNIGPLSLGLTGMYLHEQYFQQDAGGYGLNAGVGMNIFDERVRLGASLRNLGSMDELSETATELPTMLSFGADIRFLQFSTTAADDEIPLLVSFIGDFNLPLNEFEPEDGSISPQKDGYFNLGMELRVSDLIDLRGGYRTGETERRFSLGAGLLISEFYFNYAFMPYETGFGTAHAISLQYNF
ncbi:PorV/PorQ family protein [Natronogracilivirga saccharolytica]|uniref:PorV/PorQ family protein n=1 Tax=Natronogracilivirga saccharolytica TaxID=2812953 RepID=A0A8J7UVC8_9BACT|nr:PorV/PorQ family protein [Natronogracilivirga saccharolytica]MBP3192422.1 PorV/PorQ family protein [Natronogracilivirga saccharolytica]